MKKMNLLLVALLVLLSAVPSFAAQMRVMVADISVTGVQNSGEMKTTLQMLLASRLNSDKILVVGSAAEADAVVSGAYVTFGKVFSIDAVAKTTAGKTVARTFVQGESQDELIPALGKLAEKLSAELVKSYSAVPAVVAVPLPVVTAPVVVAVPPPDGEFIKPRAVETAAAGGWVSSRLDGAANLMAAGLTLPDGSREIFLAENQRLVYYRQGKEMIKVAEAEFKTTEKIISLDTLAGSDGSLDIYVTVIRAAEPASQVWQTKGDKLVLVAEKIPYYFRSAALAGGTKKLYAQSMGRDDDFFGDVYEAARNGSAITVKNPVKMPRHGNIYSFNQLRDRNGDSLTVVINPDGYLVVFDQSLKEIWRSNDKFGGSELFFEKDDDANVRTTGEKTRWVFMNQRIQVTGSGQVLAGKNDGFWVVGTARSYKKGSVYSLTWNGSSLEEKWRTRETQNYMPDFLLDEARNELLMLQTVQRPGVTTRGTSSLTIKKVE